MSPFFNKSDEILAFVYKQWSKSKIFFENYEMVYPQLITSIRWKYIYVHFRRK